MQQVLFHIPIRGFWGESIPLYGFGTMLVLALAACIWVASRRAQKEGIAPKYIQDLAIWVVLCGIIGARITFMIQYHRPIVEFFKLWEGGLVFYGSLIGGFIGYLLGYWFVLRKQQISWRKVADLIAPCLAIGLAIGRLGCLLNGCCYGDVACAHCPGIGFPLSAYPRFKLVEQGYQTAAGFTLRGQGYSLNTVDRVEPGSPAEQAGLRSGDRIVAVDGKANRIILDVFGGSQDSLRNWAKEKEAARDVERIGEDDYIRVVRTTYADVTEYNEDLADATSHKGFELKTSDILWDYLANNWPRGKNDLTLVVRHEGEANEATVGPFEHSTIHLHPTQVYESISALLIFAVLLAYYPLKHRDGMVMVLFLLFYPIHRYLNELLRNDTEQVAFGMTLSQNGSILIFASGLFLLYLVRRYRPDYPSLKMA